MKIYVSEKDQSKYVYDRESIECKSPTEPMVVKSLEQHEAEIKKPLEEEIERLKKQLDLNDKEHFKDALKQLRNADYDTIRKIERQKVIAELEEDYIESLVSYLNEQEEMEFMIYLYNNYPEIFYDILSFYMIAE